MFNSVLGAITSDLAVDLGTSTTRIAVAGRGVVSAEPSVVAIVEDRQGRRRILAVGAAAARMEGRAPRDVRVVRPIHDGSIADFEVVEAMLRHLVVIVQGRRLWVGPRVTIAVPYGITDMERRAMRESAEASGAREVILVDQPLAAAVGVGLPIHEARGHMIVDVGAGSTSVSVISLGGVVYSRSVKVGGDHMDLAIIHHVHEQHGIVIGRAMAEEARRAIGSAMPGAPRAQFLVRGRQADSGYPRAVEIDSDEVRAALQEPVGLIAESILASLERTPPDLAADVSETGIVLTGGVAQMNGLDRVVSHSAGLPVIVAEEPTLSVVLGASRVHQVAEPIRRAS